MPDLAGELSGHAIRDAAYARRDAVDTQNAMEVDESDNEEVASVKLVVLDGIVMGPTHCAFEGCTEALANMRRGVFCALHELQRYGKCRMKDCEDDKAPNAQSCLNHIRRWVSHGLRYGQQTLLGIRRIVRRTEEETQPWLPERARINQAHDAIPAPTHRKDNYFVAPRFYCVETICAPCGVVIAWTKFAYSESPTKILQFLEKVYPTPESRPAYICIDKACQVLRTAIQNGSWEVWKQTSRLIVDSYHYINHRTTDYLCRKWCNPAPLNGSAPNLVVVENDVNGNQHYTRAFNTQVCLLSYDLLLYV